MKPKERKVFFTNVYNCMVVHAHVTLGSPKTLLVRKEFFEKVSYMIGGMIFTLDDIDRGIFRGALAWPDMKNQFILPPQERDPFLHFVLCTGTLGGPPLHVYHVHNFDEKLRESTENFLLEHLQLRPNTNEIWMPKIMQFYKNDFGANDREVMTKLRNYLPKEIKDIVSDVMSHSKLDIHYHTYDWTPAFLPAKSSKLKRSFRESSADLKSDAVNENALELTIRTPDLIHKVITENPSRVILIILIDSLSLSLFADTSDARYDGWNAD
jgi:hypothetical protein